MQSVKTSRFAYTLIEVLVAMTISLILMLGVATLFQNVGTALNDAQSTLLMSGELSHAQLTMQRDLAGVNTQLVSQPNRMVNPTYASDEGGYFSITEGMNAPPSIIGAGGAHRPSSTVFATDNTNLNYDQTVADVDDILAFTTQADTSAPFRGLVDGNLVESNYAEVIWFVRGNTLYRRVLLIDDGNLNIAKKNYSASGFYQNNDLSVHLDSSTGRLVPNSLQVIKLRENRFGHYVANNNTARRGEFPYPLYRSPFESWYYLRMPTLEETISNNWNTGGQLDAGFSPANPGNSPYWDLWDKPSHWVGTTDNDQCSLTGSLNKYVANDPDDNTKKKPAARAAEDVILTNVISFDVKVWNPCWVPYSTTNGGATQGWLPPQYVDLGQNVFSDPNGGSQSVYVNYGHNFSTTPNPPNGGVGGIGFCSTGKYGGQNAEKLVSTANYSNDSLNTLVSVATQAWNGSLMPCQYDSWTIDYEQNAGKYRSTTLSNYYVDPATPNAIRPGAGMDSANRTDSSKWECPPPYDTELKSIQVTIRCFEPRSKYIRQVRITQDF